MADVMNARDAVFGSLAQCFVTIEGARYNFMQLIEFEATYEPNVVEVPILGQVNMGHKAVGGKGTWSGTAHFNQSTWREMMYRYQTTGVMSYFDIQVTNEDPTSRVGRQTVILRDCLCESVIIAKFVAGEEILDEDMSGTFERFEIPESFTPLTGFVQ